MCKPLDKHQVHVPASLSDSIWSYGYDEATGRFEIRFRRDWGGQPGKDTKVYQWPAEGFPPVPLATVREFEDTRHKRTFIRNRIEKEHGIGIRFDDPPRPQEDGMAGIRETLIDCGGLA